MDIATLAILKAMPGTAVSESLANAERAERASEIAVQYGWKLTCTDDGNGNITMEAIEGSEE